MRIFTLTLLFFVCTNVSAGFIHPMDFDGSEAQKNEVIEYITANTKQTYCDEDIDMCHDSMLRMLEEQELASFKLATQAKNREIMDRVISTYCEGELSICTYTMLNLLYEQDLKASSEKLKW